MQAPHAPHPRLSFYAPGISLYSDEPSAFHALRTKPQAINFKEVNDSLEADLDEDLHLIKMPIDQAYQAIFKGQIKDAKTIIAIMYIYANKEKLL